jgi:hypothetical protein
MQYSSRFWLYAPFAVVVILAVAVSFLWWQAAGALEKQLAGIKGRQAIPGITIDWKTAHVGGFPFRVDANFTGFEVKGDGAYGPLFWSTEKFALHALTYNRSKTVYEAAGRQGLGWTDAKGVAHAIQFLPGALHGSSITNADGLVRFDLDIANPGNTQFTAARFQFHMRRDGPNLNLMVRADSVTGLGKPRKLVQAYATLDKASTTLPFLRGEMPWTMALGLWRGLGGKATLSQTVEPELAAEALSPLY